MAKSVIRKAWDVLKKEAIAQDKELKGCFYMTKVQESKHTATISLGCVSHSYQARMEINEMNIQRMRVAVSDNTTSDYLKQRYSELIKLAEEENILLASKKEQFGTPEAEAIATLNNTIRTLSSWDTFCEVAHVYSVAYEIDSDMIMKARINYFGETIENI